MPTLAQLPRTNNNQPLPLMVSKLDLYAFRCERPNCDGRWYVVDAPISERRTWYCPWCGRRHQLPGGPKK